MEKGLDGLTLDELAERSGYERRAIRGFIQQHLLRGPGSRGRNARYSPQHLDRLRAIRALREREGLSYAEIRQRLAALGDAEVRALGDHVPAALAESALPGGSRSALGYLHALEQADAVPSPAVDVRSAAMARPTSPVAVAPYHGRYANTNPSTPLDELLRELAAILGPKTLRKARGEHWFRIPVTPDFELAVRGSQDAVMLARLERLADYLREALLGGLTPR